MIRLAAKAAEASSFRRARVGAVVSKGRRILATGHNYIGFCKFIRNRCYPESVHAEVAAIAQLIKKRRYDDIQGSTVYVARIGRAGDLRLSRPCGNCQAVMKALGIKDVVYTDDSGGTRTEIL